MARQYFNVNTQTKLIDTHKQFNGGLKTVDTDDALQDFFLRQAENVSISEFGYLEKRYGLAKKSEMVSGASGRVQGHYKFKYKVSGEARTDEILALDGRLWVKEHGGSFTLVTTYVTFSDEQYPTDPFADDGVTLDIKFQHTRDVGMARIKNNLFIFTGTYPLIYSRHNIQTGELYNPAEGKVHIMPYYVPTPYEIAGTNTGVNLLIGADYDAVMGYDDESLVRGTSQYKTQTPPKRTFNDIQTAHAPLVPFISYNALSQINLEATTKLTVVADAVTPFSSFQHNNTPYEYVEEDFQLNQFYAASATDPDGATCSSLGDRVSYDTGNGTEYYVCSIAGDDSGGAGTTTSYYQVVPKTVQFRASALFTANVMDFEDLPSTNIEEAVIYSNANNDSDFSNLVGGALPLTDAKGVWQPEYTNVTLTVDSTSYKDITTPLSVKVKGVPVGFWDFKVVWHHERIYEGQGTTAVTETIDTFEQIYSGIEVTGAKIDPSSLGYSNTAITTCNQVIERDGRLCVWGSQGDPEHIFFSYVDDRSTHANWFPASYSRKFDTDDDQEIKSVVPFMNVLIIQTETKTFGLKGNTPQLALDASNIDSVYATFPISPIYGTIAPKSVRPVRNRLYFLSREGIVQLTNLAFAADDKYNVQELDRNIKNIVPQDTEAVAIQHDYQYWINFPSTGETLRYYVDKKAWVKDTYGKDDNTEYSGNTFDFDGVFKYYSEDGALSFISKVTDLDTNPATATVFEIAIDKSLPSDFTKAIKTTFETANLNQGYPFHPKKYLENRMDFTLQNEYNTSKDAIPFEHSTTPETSPFTTVISFVSPNNLKKGHTYLLGLAANATIQNVKYELDDSGTLVTTTHSFDSDDYELTFQVPYEDFDTIEIVISHTTEIDFTTASLKDKTYDHTLTFNTFSLSEEGTLNLDNITGYNAEDAEVEINLGTVFGANETWVFDESAFDDRITAVKTVKLSGRGYNYKLFVTDRTKAKWTIENLGITFKFKRARVS